MMTISAAPRSVHELDTPALVVDVDVLDANIDAMAAARPGDALRPHVKAFKSTEMARHIRARAGHDTFCCATLKEMEGMAAAGLGEDLLLANETLNAKRLRALVQRGDARVTVAVDSPETIEVAAAAGAEVLIDVDVGLPRCGCDPADAGALASRARAAGLAVRGVMGYEGHVMGNPDRAARAAEVERAMAVLRVALDDVGGGLASAGGTGTVDLHSWADEIQAGSYLLMDTAYEALELPFRQALRVVATVISVSPNPAAPDQGFAVLDAGLKAFGMDNGNPRVEGYDVFFCSDEHTTILAADGRLPRVGDRLAMTPAHIDPTVACHEWMHLCDGEEVIDRWAVDLRNW